VPQLNDEQLASFKLLTGLDPTQLNDVTVAYLKSLTGSDSNDPQDLWYAQLVSVGYTGAVQDMQVDYWTDILGHGGQWNDLYLEWLLATGGTFGPAVILRAGSGCFCEFEPPITDDCVASCDYTAIVSGFSQPITSWVWSIVSGDAAITAGQGTATVTVRTAAAAASANDEAFELKVVASWV
jgi:hypothetical protein